VSVSIILPSLNEFKNLLLLIPQIKRNLRKIKYEIIIIDDNSNDKTCLIFRNSKRFKNIKYIKRTRDLGLGQSVECGIKNAKYEYIIVCDSDFNHDPNDINKFIKKIYLKNNYFYSGSRFKKGGYGNSFFRHYSSLIYSFIIRKILNLNTKDTLSGFFMVKKENLKFINKKNIFYGYGEYYIRLLFQINKHFKIYELPVIYTKRKFGSSKSNFIKMAFNYLFQTLKILKDV